MEDRLELLSHLAAAVAEMKALDPAAVVRRLTCAQRVRELLFQLRAQVLVRQALGG